MCRIFLCCLFHVALLRCALAQEAVAVNFWLRPKLELDPTALAPAEIVLLGTPDRSREFALLAGGDRDPRDFVNMTGTPDTGYRVIAGGLREGALIYGDRTYKIQQLPNELAGLSLLQTKLFHKPVLDGRFSVVLGATRPCIVFMAVEENALKSYERHGPPAWLQEYAPTGYQIATDRPGGGNFSVFARRTPAGRIVLGPPCTDTSINAMYFAFFGQAI